MGDLLLNLGLTMAKGLMLSES